MEIESEIKAQIKQRKLLELKQKYYTLELDKVALETVGDTEGTKEILERMESIKKAYEAINAL